MQMRSLHFSSAQHRKGTQFATTTTGCLSMRPVSTRPVSGGHRSRSKTGLQRVPLRGSCTPTPPHHRQLQRRKRLLPLPREVHPGLHYCITNGQPVTHYLVSMTIGYNNVPSTIGKTSTRTAEPFLTRTRFTPRTTRLPGWSGIPRTASAPSYAVLSYLVQPHAVLHTVQFRRLLHDQNPL